jgi:hypothetical protein
VFSDTSANLKIIFLVRKMMESWVGDGWVTPAYKPRLRARHVPGDVQHVPGIPRPRPRLVPSDVQHVPGIPSSEPGMCLAMPSASQAPGVTHSISRLKSTPPHSILKISKVESGGVLLSLDRKLALSYFIRLAYFCLLFACTMFTCH